MNKRQQGNSISRLAFLSQELLCPASPLLGARGRYPRGVLGRAPVPGDVLIDLELALASRVIHVPYLAEDGPLLPEKEKGEGGGGVGSERRMRPGQMSEREEAMMIRRNARERTRKGKKRRMHTHTPHPAFVLRSFHSPSHVVYAHDRPADAHEAVRVVAVVRVPVVEVLRRRERVRRRCRPLEDLLRPVHPHLLTTTTDEGGGEGGGVICDIRVRKKGDTSNHATRAKNKTTTTTNPPPPRQKKDENTHESVHLPLPDEL